jgi:hypothetical protein
MHRQRDDVVALRQPQQHAAQQQTLLEVERAARLLTDQGRHQCIAPAFRQPGQIDYAQRKGFRRPDHLNRCVILDREDRAERLVAAHDLTDAESQRPCIQRPFDAQRRRDVVERAARFELIDEPEPLLREGEEKRVRPRQRDQGREGLVRAGPQLRLDLRGEIRQSRGVEQGEKRHLDAESAPQA